MTEKCDVKKLVLLLTIGLCDALRANVITINEAEYYLFSPRTMRLMNHDEETRDIIHMCTEFENLARLAPKSLDGAIADVIDKAQTALKNSGSCDFESEPWLYKLLSE